MALSLDFDYLRKNELLYELRVKGHEVSDDSTVDELRKTLRSIKTITNEELSEGFLLSLNPAEELKTCQDKYNEVLNTNHVNCLRKCRAILTHVILRLERISSTNEEQKGLKINLLASSFLLLKNVNCGTSTVEVVSEPLPSTSKNLQPSLTNLSSDSAHQQSDFNTITASSKPVINQILKWNLRFNGETSVHDFIVKLNDYVKASKISDQDFLENAIYVLAGEALIWYRSVQTGIFTYAQFLDSLKTEFQSVECERSLLNQIRSRLQQPKEKIRTFINVMRYLFTRLSVPLSESEQLEIIMTNMNPFYITRLSLTTVRSIDHLKELCVNLEIAKHRCEHRGYLNPGPDIIASDFLKPKDAQNKSVRVNSVAVKCLKCDGAHHFRECDVYVGLHCFRCKKAGVTTKACSCSKNVKRGQE